MNNIKISPDGRVTAWETKLHTPKSFEAPALRESPEWELFSGLPDRAKSEFLQVSLGLSNVSNSDSVTPDTKRARRGSKGITSYGRSQVRSAAAVLEQRYGLKNLTFLTCTLPPAALTAYTPQSWAEVVHRFQKSLRYHLARAGQATLLLAVTEIQMQRWEVEQDRPPVHLHCLFHGRSASGGWCFRPDFYQQLWEVAAQSVWGVHSDWSASTRVESLRSSSVNYLGKYMSKGVDALKTISPELLPTGWYSISTKLKALIKKATVMVSGELATRYYRFIRGSKLLLWERDIVSYNPDSGFVWHMGYCCQLLSVAIYQELRGDIRDFLSTQNIPILTGML